MPSSCKVFIAAHWLVRILQPRFEDITKNEILVSITGWRRWAEVDYKSELGHLFLFVLSSSQDSLISRKIFVGWC